MSENQMNKYEQAIASSHVTEDDAAVAADVQKILDEHFAENNNADVHKFLFSTIDLTTLRSTDTPSSVARFTEAVNTFEELFPSLPNVAAICVYPNFAPVVRTVLEVSDVKIACVSGAFPSCQSFEEVKIAETALAVANGADEIDIVLNLGYFLDHDYESACDEIAEQKEACRDAHLKVILETGALKTAKNIKAASILSMYSGADFIKTSTGKEYTGASLEAAYVMAKCIKEYYEKTGRRVGFKAAGGIRSTEDAVKYYTVIKEVLGEEWLNNELFRLGASSLANALLTTIAGHEVKHF
ncbi:MAG: deoxyribose-phosphate aldolase [Muribaculaceae bacterium]|nr:deoxyribose-phosphate aldolase [Muribaculaceae bacterium]MDE6196817.1 deoxyribose-phosphate aldolase [Muribaculaceae bacterium]